ncbi:hypothetical protein AKJ16_DCAP10030 [Drosera capensis]
MEYGFLCSILRLSQGRDTYIMFPTVSEVPRLNKLKYISSSPAKANFMYSAKLSLCNVDGEEQTAAMTGVRSPETANKRNMEGLDNLKKLELF